MEISLAGDALETGFVLLPSNVFNYQYLASAYQPAPPAHQCSSISPFFQDARRPNHGTPSDLVIRVDPCCQKNASICIGEPKAQHSLPRAQALRWALAQWHPAFPRRAGAATAAAQRADIRPKRGLPWRRIVPRGRQHGPRLTPGPGPHHRRARPRQSCDSNRVRFDATLIPPSMAFED